MNRIKDSIRFVILGAIAVACVLLVRSYYAAEPVPQVDVRPQFVVPASHFMNPDESIAYYERAARQSPTVVENHLALAQAYLQKAQYLGEEVKYVPLAEAAINEALRRDSDNLHGMILKARLLNKLHQFEEALSVAESILSRQAKSSVALGIKIDALTELGRYEEAVAASDELLTVRPGLAAFARASYLRELHGDSKGAAQAMEMAVEAGVAGSLDRAWALNQLAALYIGQRQLERSEALLDGLLEERPDYAQATGTLAHITLLRGDYERAADMLEAAWAVDGRASHLELLMEIHALQGNTEAQDETAARIAAAFESAAGMGENVQMEYADFLAERGERLDEALVMARSEFERRPNHRHARETWAWTLHKTGASTEAMTVIHSFVEDARGDAKLLYRAGLIALGAGQQTLGTQLLESADQMDLALESPTASLHARETLQRLGDR